MFSTEHCIWNKNYREAEKIQLQGKKIETLKVKMYCVHLVAPVFRDVIGRSEERCRGNIYLQSLYTHNTM